MYGHICIYTEACIPLALATSSDPAIRQATSSPTSRVLDVRAFDMSALPSPHHRVILQKRLMWSKTRIFCFLLISFLEMCCMENDFNVSLRDTGARLMSRR